MADESSKSWSSTIIIYVIIFILVIAAIIIIYYVLSVPLPPQFPVSPFDYDDIVEISPAVFTQDNFGSKYKDVPQNQFLSSVTPGNNCQLPNDGYAQPNTCVATFTGIQGNLSSKWILRNSWDSTQNCGDPSKCSNDSNCPNCPNNLAKQNFTEFGNRFYLQNTTETSPGDIPALMTYMPFNPFFSPYNPSTTFPLTGNAYISDAGFEVYDFPFIVYFLPTTQPNLYYILFPDQLINSSNALDPNNGIISLRPFAQPDNNSYYPWNGTTVGSIFPNPNGMLLNNLSDSFVSVNGTASGTNNPNIFLFKITKVGKAS